MQIIGYVLSWRSYSFLCTLHHLIIIIVQTCVSKMGHILSVIYYTIRGAVCFQFTHFLMMIEMIYILLSYYHHQIGNMNYYPLFRVRSWNNGVRCMSFYILMSNTKRQPSVTIIQISSELNNLVALTCYNKLHHNTTIHHSWCMEGAVLMIISVNVQELNLLKKLVPLLAMLSLNDVVAERFTTIHRCSDEAPSPPMPQPWWFSKKGIHQWQFNVVVVTWPNDKPNSPH